jgi:hypothetical protein
MENRGELELFHVLDVRGTGVYGMMVYTISRTRFALEKMRIER